MKKIKILIILFYIIFFSANYLYCKEYKRIITTTPNITEIAYFVGAGDNIVGVSKYCNYPEETNKKEKIGDSYSLNLELVIALEPDLIILPDYSLQQYKTTLDNLNIETLFLKIENIKDIFTSIKIVAQKLGVMEKTLIKLSWLEDRLEKLRKTAKSIPQKRVLVIIWRDAGTLEGLYGASTSDYLGEIVEICGGKNIIETEKAYPQINLEEIIIKDPEIIIDLTFIGSSKEELIKLFREKFPNISAVKNNRIYVLTEKFYTIPGPRFIKVLNTFLAIFQK